MPPRSLRDRLLALRPKMAAAAQQEYDQWEPNDEGEDEEFGYGGICDRVAEAIGGVIVSSISDVEIIEGGQEGDDHAWVIVHNARDAYGVDIPANIYEAGGGYSWEKVPGVKFRADDVEVFKVDHPGKWHNPSRSRGRWHPHMYSRRRRRNPVEGKPPVRFKAGKKLTAEQRKIVIRSITDVYAGMPKVFKGFDARGEDIYGYEYRPDLFEKSAITGRGVRYYVKLPDGRKAHPSELYPELTEPQIEREMLAEKGQARLEAQYEKEAKEKREQRVVGAEAGENWRGEANKRYQLTRRLMFYSYFAEDDAGRHVRVDGLDPAEVAYYEGHGFKRITPPVKPQDAAGKALVRTYLVRALEHKQAVPAEVLADFPDLAAKNRSNPGLFEYSVPPSTVESRIYKKTTIPGGKTPLLSFAGKVGASFSLPAMFTCPGSSTGAGYICDDCYALGRGNYALHDVVRAGNERCMWLTQKLNEGKVDEVATAIAEAIVRTGAPSIRIHDAGDFWRPDYIKVWKQVVERLPHVYFWAPTRSWRVPELLPHLVELNKLPNISVRPSALRWNDPPPVVPGLSAGTTGHTTEEHPLACPAAKKATGTCWSENCDVCWRKEGQRSYPRHLPVGPGKAGDRSRRNPDQPAGFYSQLERIVDQKFPNRFSVEQARGILKGSPVKEDEIKWTGFEKFLTEYEGRQITKKDVLDYLERNRVRVQDRVLGMGSEREQDIETRKIDRKIEQLKEKMDEVRANLTGGYRISLQRQHPDWTARDTHVQVSRTMDTINQAGAHLAREGALREVDKINLNIAERAIGKPIIDEYLALDKELFGLEEEQETLHRARVEQGSRHPQYQLPGGLKYRELLLTLPKGSLPDDWEHQHWQGVSNVLAWVRFNERSDDEGDKVMFLEEVQSDWHEEGRKKGYSRKPTFEEFRAVRPYMSDTAARFAWDEIQAGRMRDLGNYPGLSPHGPPAAPFAKTWPDLVVKRVLLWAAQHGYDKVAWTTGKQQVERWTHALRQAVDAISWAKAGGDDAEVDIIAYRNEVPVFDHTIALTGETVINGQRMSLDDLLGKRMAEDIRKSEMLTGSFTGPDLTIGGEGFRYFYETMLPSTFKKYAEKFGGKLGEIKVIVPEPRTPRVEIVGEEPPKRRSEFVSVPAVLLTPSMRETITAKGFPLFNPLKLAHQFHPPAHRMYRPGRL